MKSVVITYWYEIDQTKRTVILRKMRDGGATDDPNGYSAKFGPYPKGVDIVAKCREHFETARVFAERLNRTPPELKIHGGDVPDRNKPFPKRREVGPEPII